MVMLAPTAAAQDWSGDARSIALGGVDRSRVIDVTPAAGQPDTVIVLPFGLLQVLRHPRVYDPRSPRFDPVLAALYVSSPLHFIIGRDTPSRPLLSLDDLQAGQIDGIGIDTLSGFSAGRLSHAGLVAPTIGRTVGISRDHQGGAHGVYLGAGPYIGLRARLAVDTRLDTPAGGLPSTGGDLLLSGALEQQIAAAITVGYRARFALPSVSSGTARDSAIDVAIDYSYLRGLLYNRDDLDLLVPALVAQVPLTGPTGEVRRTRATRGNGGAVDVAVGALFGRWEARVAVDGIGNRIRWTRVRQTTAVDIVETGATTTSLPVEYRGHLAHTGDTWTVALGAGAGFGRGWVHAGVERRLGAAALRGGLRYSDGRWNPTGGVGIPVSSRVSLDLAAFGTTMSLAGHRQLGIAASLRVKAPEPRFTELVR